MGKTGRLSVGEQRFRSGSFCSCWSWAIFWRTEKTFKQVLNLKVPKWSWSYCIKHYFSTGPWHTDMLICESCLMNNLSLSRSCLILHVNIWFYWVKRSRYEHLIVNHCMRCQFFFSFLVITVIQYSLKQFLEAYKIIQNSNVHLGLC